MSEELPPGWELIMLGELFDFNYGKGLPKEKRNPNGTIKVYGSNGVVGVHDTAVTKGPAIIIGRKGSVGEVNFSLEKCWPIDTTYFIDDFPSDLPPGYWTFYLKSLRLEQQEKSSAIPGISRDDIYALEVLVPPLAEQRRIVAMLEKLLCKADACQKRLMKIPVLLKRFRQAVVAAACSGRLTADWRESNPSPAIANQVKNVLLEIPLTWRWFRLPEIGEMNRGKSRHRPRDAAELYDGPYPFIQTGDIAQSGGRITKHKQTYNETGLGQSRLWPAGTVCITIAANIAESALLTYPACFPDSIVGVIAHKEFAVPEYIEYFMRVAKSDLSTFAPATAQKNINIGILNEVQVPLPPVTEQQEIVRRVEALFALADQTDIRYAKSKAQVDRLTNSILAKAFHGELVPQDPNDEPAEKLLERIKSNKRQDGYKTRYSRESKS